MKQSHPIKIHTVWKQNGDPPTPNFAAAAGFGHINGSKMLLVEVGARYKVFDMETRSQGVNIARVGGEKAIFMVPTPTYALLSY